MEMPANSVEIWDEWNSNYRQGWLDEPSKRRMGEVVAVVKDLKLKQAKILEVGCGTGWLSDALSKFGKVTAFDLGKRIIEIAQEKYPQVEFLSGDVHTLDLPTNHYDVVVTSEVLSHVVDQTAFLSRLAELLKPGGHLLITTQNKYVFDRTANIRPAIWIRKWVTMKMLKQLLRPEFSLVTATTLEPEGHLGVLQVVNSRRLNNYFDAVLGPKRVKRLKERLGLGQSLFVVAAKR